MYISPEVYLNIFLIYYVYLTRKQFTKKEKISSIKCFKKRSGEKKREVERRKEKSKYSNLTTHW